MIERKPDFEDEKIRAWAAGPKDRELEKSEGDPTVMSLDVEHEEIFESRTYRFRGSSETLFYLMGLVTSRHFELGLSPGEVMQAAELMEDTTFKFLAKRSKEDSLISSLLVAVGSNDRSLLLRQEWVEESGTLEGSLGDQVCVLVTNCVFSRSGKLLEALASSCR